MLSVPNWIVLWASKKQKNGTLKSCSLKVTPTSRIWRRSVAFLQTFAEIEVRQSVFTLVAPPLTHIVILDILPDPPTIGRCQCSSPNTAKYRCHISSLFSPQGHLPLVQVGSNATARLSKSRRSCTCWPLTTDLVGRMWVVHTAVRRSYQRYLDDVVH